MRPVRTVRRFRFEDGTSLRVVRRAAKGAPTKWKFVLFEPDTCRAQESYELVGNGWRWEDAVERADQLVRYHGPFIEEREIQSF